MRTTDTRSLLGWLTVMIGCGVASGVAAATVTRLGTLDVEMTLTLNPAIPDGTSVSANITVSAQNGNFSNTVLISGTATAAGGKASFSIPIAYGWEFAAVPATYTLDAYVSATFTRGVQGVSLNSDIQAQGKVPANNATTTVTITGSL